MAETHKEARLGVFISYSRDDLAFADQLEATLTLAGFEATLDRHGIEGGEDWMRRLGNLIRDADTVVFILSPTSARSSICEWEVGEAVRLGKRIIPVVYKPLEGASPPSGLKSLNYIYFYAEPRKPGSGYGPGLLELARALNTDLAWLREHTRLLLRATEWEAASHSESRLLFGDSLAEAKAWSGRRPREAPEPTALHLEYIRASEEAEARHRSDERQKLERIAEAQAERALALAEKEKAQARARRRLYLLAAPILAGLVGVVALSRHTSVREAEVFASAAELAFEQSLCDHALRLAVAGLPDASALPWAYRSPSLEGQLARYGAVCPLRQRFDGHMSGVHDAALDQTGGRLLTASWDRTARLWDVETGALVRTFPEDGRPGHTEAVESVAWSPDGTALVTGSWDGTARMWDVGTGDSRAVFAGHTSRIESAVLSPDGKRLLTASHDRTARVWDVASAREIGRCLGHADMLHAARFNRDGTMLVTASWDGTARVWSVDAAGRCHEVRRLVVPGSSVSHRGPVFDAAFSRLGDRIATGGNDGIARIWDAVTGELLMTLRGHEKAIHGLSFGGRADRELLATASADWSVMLWDAADGAPVRTLKGHMHTAHSARFSGDGDHLVTSSQDGSARLWRWTAGAPEIDVRSDRDAGLRLARLSVDDTVVVTASQDGKARIYDTASGRRIGELDHGDTELTDARIAPDGSLIATASNDGRIKIWSTANHKLLAELGDEWQVQSMTFSPNGKLLAVVEVEGPVRLWDIESRTRLPLPEPIVAEAFSSVVFTRDSRSMLAAAMSGKAFLWDVGATSSVREFEGHSQPLWSAVLDASERKVLTGSRDGTSCLWDAVTGARERCFTGHEEAVRTAQASPDGRRIVTASWDRTARIFAAERSTALHVLRGHRDTLSQALFSPGAASRVLTASEDKTARLWDAATGVEIRRFNGFTDAIASAQITTDGRRIVVAARDDTVRIWRLEPILDVAPEERRTWVCRYLLGTPGLQSFSVAEMQDPLMQGKEHLRNPCRPLGLLDRAQRWLRSWTS
ncbi:MAG: TIR domain-containing protein [Pseudomonadota bacterium]